VTLLLRHRLEGDLVIEVAFTGSSLDVGDRAEPAVREAALARVAAETGATPVLMHQVHGTDAVFVDDPRTSSPVSCDAIYTAQTGVALLARAADCVPLLLADAHTGWIAAVHAGRNGLAGGVVPATVRALRDRGARPDTAWIGPHVCGSCYEVPEEMQAEVAGLVPEAASTTSWGTPALDLGAGVHAQLGEAGVDSVHDTGICTLEDADWPSHRRDGASATRFAGLIWSHR
jgi:YfiH family protein